jgi:hypothetical protein
MTEIRALDERTLLATFDGTEKRVRDMSDLILAGKVFEPLQNPGFFKTVRLVYGAPTWIGPQGQEIDICPDTFYLESRPWEG